MKISLADAIRQGSKVTKRGEGLFTSRTGKTTCALGAALVAIGFIKPGKYVSLNFDYSGLLEKNFKVLGRKVINPVTSKKESLFHTIVLLNDTYRWSRQRIAEFVEQIEKSNLKRTSLNVQNSVIARV